MPNQRGAGGRACRDSYTRASSETNTSAGRRLSGRARACDHGAGLEPGTPHHGPGGPRSSHPCPRACLHDRDDGHEPLIRKGLLERSEERRPYTYWARVSPEDFSAGRMLEVLGELKDKKAVLARFVARIDPEDAELLRQLVKDLGRARQ